MFERRSEARDEKGSRFEEQRLLAGGLGKTNSLDERLRNLGFATLMAS
jgi:hypothetical protein